MPPDVRLPWKLQALLLQMMDPDPFKRPRSMAEIKGTLTPYVTSWQTWPSIINFGLMSLMFSGFIESPFVALYLYLALAFMMGSCIYALLQSWRTSHVRPSARAATIIMGK
jgi:hypothetical protein